MTQKPVHIDFQKVKSTFRIYLREKALHAKTHLVYLKGNELVEEDPQTRHHVVIKHYR